MKRYGVVLEPTRTGHSAHVPDLPGCVATGRNRRQVLYMVRGATRFRIGGFA